MGPISPIAARLGELARELDSLALFLILVVEEAGIYIPLPGNWLMAYAGVRAAEGTAEPMLLLAAGVSATAIGATVLYWLARRGGRRLLARHGHRLGLTAGRQVRIENWLARYGALAVFVGRLAPGLRCGSSFAAGLFGIAFAPFFAATVASAFVWWGFWLWLGWALGPSVLRELDATAGQFLAVIALISLGGTAAVLVRGLWPRLYALSAVALRSARSAVSRSITVSSTRAR